jgi:hypothetical protein
MMKEGKAMLSKRFALFAGMLLLMQFVSPAGFAAKDCVEKSLFVNISSERARAVQVGLLVAMANAGGEELVGTAGGAGQEADVQLFFADAAAPYVLDLDTLGAAQKEDLDYHLRDEFGYGVDDVQRLQEQDPVSNGLPGIFFLRDEYGAGIYVCTMCVMETLGAIGVDLNQGPGAVLPYLIEGAKLMKPDGFSVIYDRKERGCSTSATVISY